MLTILNANSTRFVSSKRSCDEKSRMYDERRKIPSVVEQNYEEKELGTESHQELQDPHDE
jgi:hypothetical protein